MYSSLYVQVVESKFKSNGFVFKLVNIPTIFHFIIKMTGSKSEQIVRKVSFAGKQGKLWRPF